MIALCISPRANERVSERSLQDMLVFGCGYLVISAPSSLFVGGGGFVLLAWLGDRGDENFEGSCAEIPKLSSGRSLNSCVYCKISILVTSKALEIFRFICKCTKNKIADVSCDLNLACDLNSKTHLP